MAAGDQFLQYFPEFSNATVYPTARIAFWISVAVIQLPQPKWGNLYEYGVDLFAAHHLVIEKNNMTATMIGGVPGQSSGPISSKSIAEVSYTVDTAAITYAGAGYWNQTGYGINFWNLLKSLGAGGLQLGYVPDASFVQTGVFPFNESTGASYG